MTFKIDKNLLCDVCGKPVKSADVYKKLAYTCSNPACRHSVTFEVELEPNLPEWVVEKGVYKGIE